MPKLTVDELDRWADEWNRRIDAMLVSSRVDSTAKRHTSSVGYSIPRNTFEKSAEISGVIENVSYKRNKANGLSPQTTRHQGARPVGNGFFTSQDEAAIAIVAVEPDGREV